MADTTVHYTSGIGNSDEGRVTVDDTANGHTLRERIANDLLLDTDAISIHHNGSEIPDNTSLKDAGLSDGSSVKVLPSNPEGGLSSSVPSISRARLKNELKKVKRNNIRLRPVRNNPETWKGKIRGSGKWAGEVFPIRVELPPDYPDSPPKIYFEKRPQPPHPNLFSTGKVCLNLVMRDWQPHYTLAMVYESLKWWFENPNYHSIADPDMIDSDRRRQPTVPADQGGGIWDRMPDEIKRLLM